MASAAGSAPGPAVARGEVQVDLGDGASGHVRTGQSVSLEGVAAIAARIWAAVGRANVADGDDAGADALLQQLQGEYKEFATSYPVPFRWMVQAREYDPRAFKKYLRDHVKMMYKDRKEFMAAQAEYLVLLYKARNPRVGVRPLARYRAAVVKSLQEEDDKFAEARTEAEAEVGRLDAAVDDDRRRRLHEYLCRLRAGRAESEAESGAENDAGEGAESGAEEGAESGAEKGTEEDAESSAGS